MPELPEVETTLRGLAPHVLGKRVARVVVRQPRLRWRVPPVLVRDLPGQVIRALSRRGKYLLLGADTGTVILHLGMSGSLRVVPCRAPPAPHDHVDIALADGRCLRLRDPRRFGALLWSRNPSRHRLIAALGPEPLSGAFGGAYLFRVTRGRKRAIRDCLLDGRLVAGVGNIYANESLFAAGIRPQRPAGRISRAGCDRLARAVRATLRRAIRAGGSSLRDFRRADGSPGYFQLTAAVYGRQGAPCRRCGRPVRALALHGRTAYYCPRCQG